MRRRVSLIVVAVAVGLTTTAGCGESAKVQVPEKTVPPPKDKPIER